MSGKPSKAGEVVPEGFLSDTKPNEDTGGLQLLPNRPSSQPDVA